MTEQQLRGLTHIRVDKKFLLTTLKKNRVEHEKTYYEILEARQEKIVSDIVQELKKATKNVKEQAKKAKADKEYKFQNYTIAIDAPMPENHTKDYDRIISYLNASLDKEFELTSIEFDQYVNDDWSWKSGFITCSGTYMPSLTIGD